MIKIPHLDGIWANPKQIGQLLISEPSLARLSCLLGISLVILRTAALGGTTRMLRPGWDDLAFNRLGHYRVSSEPLDHDSTLLTK